MSTLSMSTRTRAGVLFVLALAVALPVMGIAFHSTAAAPSPGASPASTPAVAGAAPAIDPTTTSLPTTGPTPRAACELPASLPAAPAPAARPIVGQRSVAMLLTSYLYDQLTD